jgi:cytidylate kinase
VCLYDREIDLKDYRYLNALKFVVRDLAESRSLVMQRHGTQFILRDYPQSLHVLVVAPIELRIIHIMKSLKLDQEAAKKVIARFDSGSHEFIRKYFRAEVWDPVNYDLVVNTAHLDFQVAASIIVDALSFRIKP